VVDWSTVPTYIFCGPAQCWSNSSELAFFQGKDPLRPGYKPRWISLGYATLYGMPANAILVASYV
jgi:hypothetical protein